MADSFIEKQTYLDKPSTFHLLKSRLTVSERTLRIVLPVALFLLILLPRLLSLNTFLTADEDDQIMFATHFLKSILRQNWGGALILGYPGIPTLFLGASGVAARYLMHYSGWLPLPWITADFMTTLDQVTRRFGVFEYPLDFIMWVRVPMVLAASLSIFGIYLLTARLVNRPVAVVATLIIAFDPFILAHTRVIHVDGPLSYFMFLSFLAFMLYLKHGRWQWLLLSGLFGGLAGLSKTPAALLGLILVASGISHALFPPGEQLRRVMWKRVATAVIVWGLVALAAVFVLWPSMWSRPLFAIERIIHNIYHVNLGAHPTTGIFWGGWQTDQNPLYYLIVFPYHLTPLTALGVLAGLGMILTGLTTRWQKLTAFAGQMLPVMLSLVAYVVIFMAPVSIISRRGDRYILPVYFAVGLFSALALWWLAGWLLKHLPAGRLKLTQARLVGGAVLVQILFILVYHPYYLAYFNPLMGSYRTAPYRVNIGWGEGLDQAAAYLNRKTAVEDTPVQVASWYSAQFAPYYNGETIDLSNQEAALTSNYTVFYINQVQRGFPSKEILHYFRQRNPEHVVTLGGIEYAWIYQGPVIGENPAEDFVFPVEALLGGGARLYGVDMPVLEMPADTFAASARETDIGDAPYLGYKETIKGLPVTLFWETIASIQSNHGKVNTFIRLVDERGNIWGQTDRLILDGLWRTNRWHAGFYLRDEYKLPIDPATPPGTYHLEVGLYDFETGQSYGLVRNVGKITLTAPQTLPQVADLNLNTTVSQTIDDALTLVGHTFTGASFPPGAEIVGKVFWQATGAVDHPYQLEFAFLGPDNKKYLVGEQGLSTAYPAERWRNSEIVGEAYRFRIPAVAPPGEYPLLVSVINATSGEYIGQPVELAEITVEALERNFELPENVTPISAVLDDQIELVGYRLEDQTVTAHETFGLTLYWRSLDFADSNYTVFVHAVGPDQGLRGQWDSMPMQGAAPTGGWLPGEVVEDHFDVLMGKDVPPWKYDIFVGMYDPVTGERLPIFSPNAPVSENRVWLTRIQAVE